MAKRALSQTTGLPACRHENNAHFTETRTLFKHRL